MTRKLPQIPEQPVSRHHPDYVHGEAYHTAKAEARQRVETGAKWSWMQTRLPPLKITHRVEPRPRKEEE